MKTFTKTILIIFFCNCLAVSQWQIISNQGATSKIFFTDSIYGFTGSNTLSAKTTNGGVNWTVISNTGASMFYINSLTGWHSGFPGRIEKTTNGGSTFVVQPTTSTDYLFDVFFINLNTGWAVGGTTTESILKTTNSGSNWLFQTSNTSYGLYSLCFIDEFTGWAAGSQFASKIIHTTNGGTNWISQSTPQNSSIFSIRFVDALTGWAVGGTNNVELIFKTTNGGINWLTQNSPVNNGLRDCALINPDTAFAVGIGGRIIKTTNGGTNWISQNSTTSNDLVSMKFINPNTGYVCGGNTILKTTNGGITFLNNNSGMIPSKYELYQNYPNPFNPVTRIQYIISEVAFIQIRVSDVTGKVINEFIDKSKIPGTYEIDFDASNLPSGIYFYTLIADNITITTKRMVLLK